jgi:hypothetical protein
MKTYAGGSLGGTKGHINAATHPCSSAEVPVKPVGLAFVSFSLCFLSLGSGLSKRERGMWRLLLLFPLKVLWRLFVSSSLFAHS